MFVPSDTAEFREMTALLLAKDAARLRCLEPAEYVRQCRVVWDKARTDKLYATRFIVDELLFGDGTDLYCAVVAEVHVETDLSGIHWRAPKDYARRHKPLDRYRRELVHVYPTGGLRPEPDEPEASPQLVALFDLLGFEAKLGDLGLANMHERYREMVRQTFLPAVAQGEFSLARGMLEGELREGYLQLPIRYAYFSDTFLMWAPLHNAFVGTFLDRCASLFCNALEVGFPMRGAISVGDVVLHGKSNTYLGEPLVEAARLEAAQDTLGVALGVSVRSIALPPDRIQRYDPPVKPGKKSLLSGVVVDWPRFWRAYHDGSAAEKLSSLRVPAYAKYYDNAIDFADFSEKNSDCLSVLGPVARAELEAQIGQYESA